MPSARRNPHALPRPGGWAVVWRKNPLIGRGGMGSVWHRTQAAAIKHARQVGRGLARSGDIRATVIVYGRTGRHTERTLAHYGPKGGAPHRVAVMAVSSKHGWEPH